MLYDNAELPMAYLDGYRLTGDASYARVASETLGFLDRELPPRRRRILQHARRSEPTAREQAGNAGSDESDDADDVADVEGAFYVWTPAEVDAVLDEPAASLAKDRYGIRSGELRARDDRPHDRGVDRGARR